MASDDEDLSAGAMFQEPDDYFQPEKPSTQVEYTLLSGITLNLRLVGHNPLWGHLLWTAAIFLSEYLEQNAATLIQGKDVLELGAGAGLPSLVAAILGAQNVVVTDYPDEDLIQNLSLNIANCPYIRTPPNITAKGYLWGAPPSLLLPTPLSSSKSPPSLPTYDTLILADLLFNHTEHAKLLRTVQQTLRHDADSKAIVFFTPHRPHLYHKDMAFFDLVRQGGLRVEKIIERIVEKPIFENDVGVSTCS
ncbi:nicotinamide n-methyltransferase [Toensbergia leucococca]|nr:nicotinamide n-methyltransferase [Toensbergia leucococca]